MTTPEYTGWGLPIVLPSVTPLLVIPLQRANFTRGSDGVDDIVIAGSVSNTGSFAEQQAVADDDDNTYIWLRQLVSTDRQEQYVFLDNPPQPPVYPSTSTFTAARLAVRYTSNVPVSIGLQVAWEHPAGTSQHISLTNGFVLPAASTITDEAIDLSGLAGGVGANLPFTPDALQVTYPSGWSSPYPPGYVGGAVSIALLGNNSFPGENPLVLSPSLPIGADVRIRKMSIEIDWS